MPIDLKLIAFPSSRSGLGAPATKASEATTKTFRALAFATPGLLWCFLCHHRFRGLVSQIEGSCKRLVNASLNVYFDRRCLKNCPTRSRLQDGLHAQRHTFENAAPTRSRGCRCEKAHNLPDTGHKTPRSFCSKACLGAVPDFLVSFSTSVFLRACCRSRLWLASLAIPRSIFSRSICPSG